MFVTLPLNNLASVTSSETMLPIDVCMYVCMYEVAHVLRVFTSFIITAEYLVAAIPPREAGGCPVFWQRERLVEGSVRINRN